MPPIRFSVQAEPGDIDSWLLLARRVESSGFEALLTGDHPARGASPWVALGAAAAVTTTLRLGTYVLQAGVRDPVQAAADAATLDALAPGRVRFGLGAGHTFREWEVSGGQRPSAGDRAGRLAEFVEAVAGLLNGDTVTIEGRYLRLDAARLEGFATNGRVHLVVGGGNRQVLRVAASRAEVVALNGLGRTLSDGHRHEVRWSSTELDAQLRVIRQESAHAGTTPDIEVLVQLVQETKNRSQVLAELNNQLPDTAPDDLAVAPFVLVGTVEEMAQQLLRQRHQLGISRCVVRESALEPIERVMTLLNDR